MPLLSRGSGGRIKIWLYTLGPRAAEKPSHRRESVSGIESIGKILKLEARESASQSAAKLFSALPREAKGNDDNLGAEEENITPLPADTQHRQAEDKFDIFVFQDFCFFSNRTTHRIGSPFYGCNQQSREWRESKRKSVWASALLYSREESGSADWAEKAKCSCRMRFHVVLLFFFLVVLSHHLHPRSASSTRSALLSPWVVNRPASSGASRFLFHIHSIRSSRLVVPPTDPPAADLPTKAEHFICE